MPLFSEHHQDPPRGEEEEEMTENMVTVLGDPAYNAHAAHNKGEGKDAMSDISHEHSKLRGSMSSPP